MNVALIPVRGGSKSIPLKNIKMIGGRPLVYWTLRAACGCKYIDRVYVSTDSKEIQETVEQFKTGSERELFAKAEVIGRSAESATDTASTEYVMLEFAAKYEFDHIALVQATSPLLQSEDLNRGFEVLQEEHVDSVLSVVRQKRFNWENDECGFTHPTNYDVFRRPRRQEMKGYLVENGAFYISSKEDLIRSKNRVSGKIKAVEMSEDAYFEIDEISDWTITEALMKKNGITAPFDFSNIRMVLTDCDGCLTDGGMYYSEQGDELKKFNTRDGMGFGLLHKRGILTGIVTSECVTLNHRRAKKLKLDLLEDGCQDKLAAVERICEEKNIALSEVCYIGDDLNDLEVIQAVGYGCCPADAVQKVKGVADYVTKAAGGGGVIREVVEKIIDGK